MSQEWSRALAVQHQIAEFWNTNQGKRYAGIKPLLGGHLKPDPIVGNPSYDLADDPLAAELHRTILLESETYYVNDELTNLVEHASQSFLPGRLHPDELSSDQGFCLFHHPIHMTDRDGTRCGAVAMAWRVIPNMTSYSDPNVKPAPGVLVTLYADRDDPKDDWVSRARERLGVAQDRFHEVLPKYLLLHWLGWRFEAHYDFFAEDDTADWRPVPGALWALLRQKIAVTTQQPVMRQVRRQATRAGIKHVSSIRVVTLRRASYRHPVGGDENPQAIDWSHRWIVGGHWRWQWYPTLDRHERIWIAPYVKGPEDKELVVKRTVFNVDR